MFEVVRIAIACFVSLVVTSCAWRETAQIPHFRALPPDDGLLHAPPSASPEDRTVQIRTADAECSGALIAPDLVLTARHCVVSEKGSVDAPSAVRVEIGAVDSPWGETLARDVRVADCDSDAALIATKRSVVGVDPFVVRNEPPTFDDELVAFGYGNCGTGGLAPLRSRRGQLRSVQGQDLVIAIESCPGDSGGPVTIEGTNEIVGVVSASEDALPRWPALASGRTAVAWVDDPTFLFRSAPTGDDRATCERRAEKLPKRDPPPFGQLDCFDGWCD